jgi:probable F420-dependent oxidoreductase
MGEHAVTFDAYEETSSYPYHRSGRVSRRVADGGIVEPLTSAAALAMCTTTLRLCTGVAILPQRNPVYFAKEAGAVQMLAQGRLIAGVGLGWSKQEYAALQVPWERRGARLDEYVRIVRALWTGEYVEADGEFYQLPRCRQLPAPFIPPSVFVGGESQAALGRVAAYGDGWVANQLSVSEMRERLATLNELLDAAGRAAREVELVVAPVEEEVTAEQLEEFGELGVHEVLVPCVGGGLSEFERRADDLATRLLR